MIKLKKTFISHIAAMGGTDKERNHPYGTIYDLVFNHQYLRKGEAVSVLEIGVSKGGSMVAYIDQGEQYINKIVGIDIEHKLRKAYRHRIAKTPYAHVEIGNAYTDEFIKEIEKKYGKFDIIIDDGPHSLISQEFTLRRYHDLLNEGGVILIEDVAYNSRAGELRAITPALPALPGQQEPWLEDLKKIKEELDLYIIDLRHNRTPDRFGDSLIILRYK
tara:strand:- start:2217 stop:2870 length:654 start_codon:yes stop_codon:yes gene_type:complete